MGAVKQTDPRPRLGRRRRKRRGPRLFPLILLVSVGIVGWYLFRSWARGGPTALPLPENPDWITQDLLPRNPYSRPGDLLEEINGIVIHYVGNPGTTAAQNHSYFAGLARSGDTYASSHFLVGLEGEILQNVPLNEIAYCSNDRNSDTISIECCHPDEEGKFNDATYLSLVKLTRWLMDYYHLESNQVIRHYDVKGKECPLYYVRHPDAWAAFLEDLEPEETN